MRLPRACWSLHAQPHDPQIELPAWRGVLTGRKAPAFANIAGADPLEYDEVAAEIRAIAEALERERDAS